VVRHDLLLTTVRLRCLAVRQRRARERRVRPGAESAGPGRRAPGPRPRGRSTAAGYSNRDGNQQTSVDFDGRTTSVREGVFKRRFDASSRWHAEDQARDAIVPGRDPLPNPAVLEIKAAARAPPLARRQRRALPWGHARRTPGHSGRHADQGGSPSRRPGAAHSSLVSASLVPFLAAASRPPCGRRCAIGFTEPRPGADSPGFGASEEEGGGAGSRRQPRKAICDH